MGGISRNSPCECGSGKKYKHCCLGKVESSKPPKSLFVAMGVAALIGVGAGFGYGWGAGFKVGVVGVILVGIGGILIKPPAKKRDRASGSNIDFGR